MEGSALLWLLPLFLLIQIGMALFAARRIATEADYLVAGRTLGTGAVSVSLFATWFGAEVLTSTPGGAALEGPAALLEDPIAYALTFVFLGLFLAGRLRAKGYLTIGDFFRERFGHRAESFAVLVIVPMSFLWAAAQILALAHLAESLAGISFTTVIYAVAGTTAICVFLGGMRADVYTDLFQALVVFLGIGAMALFVVQALGGWDAALVALEEAGAANPAAPEEGKSLLEWSDLWAVPILGAVVEQEIIGRTLAAKDEKTARRSCFAAAGLYLVFGLAVCFIAMAGRALVPGTPGAEDFTLALAGAALPEGARVLFLLAFLSAVISTLNSNALSISSLIGRGLIRLHEKQAPEGIVVLVQRLLAVFSLIIAAVLALSSGSIEGLVEASSAFGSAGVIVCILGGLYMKRGREAAALATLAIGIATSTLGICLEWSAPFTIGLAACILVWIGMSALPERFYSRFSSGT